MVRILGEGDPTEQLIRQLTQMGAALPEREHRFSRRIYRFDLAWPARRLAAEIEGGVRSGGRHTRGEGYTQDCIKYNLAALLGWRVLRFPPELITSGLALSTILWALGDKPPDADWVRALPARRQTAHERDARLLARARRQGDLP